MSRRWIRRLIPILIVFIVIGLWFWITERRIYPHFIIPPPQAVWETGLRVLNDGTLAKHLFVTLEEMLLGLFFGVSSALILGYLIAKSPLFETLLTPFILAFQSTPIVAYAPLLIIWFGTGPTSKVVTCAFIVFFPMLMNTVTGLRNIPVELQDLMYSLKATRWQRFSKLEVPAALPVLLTGLKTSVSLAVIGAVIGEFVGAQAGLGYLVSLARNQYDTALVVITVLSMTSLSLILYALVALMEYYLLAWRRRGRHS